MTLIATKAARARAWQRCSIAAVPIGVRRHGGEQARWRWRSRPRPRQRVFAAAALVLMALASLAFTAPAHALKAIELDPAAAHIEITNLADYYDGRGDRLQVDTAPGPDGISARIVVRAALPSTNPNWMVFALHNPGAVALERWLTAARYNIIGSGAIWPDLDSRRIEAVTPSLGVIPDRVKNDQTDIFRITLPPGKTITFVAELASESPARIYLSKPLSFTQKSRDKQLFNGIMLGIVGLLGIFLTAVFAANHKAIFPSAALVTWCVLAYLCVEFGFWHKLFQLRPEDNALYRAASEAAVAASLVIFLFTFLRLSVWHGFVRMVFAVWITAQLGLVFAAILDPKLASTFARLSMVSIGAIGGLLSLVLAVRGQDRALSLIPTWLLFGVWIFGAAMAMNGQLSGEVAVSGLIAGLVLFVLLIGFTVTQFAFRSVEPIYGAAPNQLQLRSMAIDGAGSAVWEWNSRRDEIKVSPILEVLLGLNIGELSTKVEKFVNYLHPSDRERLRLTLFSAKEKAPDHVHLDFRMRHADNSYRWFELEAAPVPGAERNAVRCVGLMRDVTDARRSTERLMHDAVHDSLTGLPGRELFLDRLGIAMTRARAEAAIRPTIIFVDIDKFRSVNSSFGLIVGDSLLLTVARRLNRNIGETDTLARVGGDQFAILLNSAGTPKELAELAEAIRQSLRTPINIAGQEIVLTLSIGIAMFDGVQETSSDLLRESEIAMYRAKRAGSDRLEIFKPAMRTEKDERITIESDLRRALERKQLKLLYQPIVYLATEELAGFEALVRWEHPKLGLLNPANFVPIAEETDLIVKLGSFVLGRAAMQSARWHKELQRPDNPLFVSVNISSRQLFRQDLIQELRHILGQAIVPKGSLRLEVTESLVMENPEQATQMLDQLKSAGAELSLDDFGTGYSSLAYLQRFPFDTIKIDKSLVQGSGNDGAEPVIVRSIVALAHELDKKVIAEGVETAEDVGFLRSIGCGYAQGYFYGEPMGEREVLQLLRRIAKSERRLLGKGLFRAKDKKKVLLPGAQPPSPPSKAPKPAGKAPVDKPPAQEPVAPAPDMPAPSAAAPAPAPGTGAAPPTSPGRENWLKRRAAAADEAQSAAAAAAQMAAQGAGARPVKSPASPAEQRRPPAAAAGPPAGAGNADRPEKLLPWQTARGSGPPAAADQPAASKPAVAAAKADAAPPQEPAAAGPAQPVVPPPPSPPAPPADAPKVAAPAQQPRAGEPPAGQPRAGEPPTGEPPGQEPPAQEPLRPVDLSTLPPAIAASLARLAGDRLAGDRLAGERTNGSERGQPENGTTADAPVKAKQSDKDGAGGTGTVAPSDAQKPGKSSPAPPPPPGKGAPR